MPDDHVEPVIICFDVRHPSHHQHGDFPVLASQRAYEVRARDFGHHVIGHNGMEWRDRRIQESQRTWAGRRNGYQEACIAQHGLADPQLHRVIIDYQNVNGRTHPRPSVSDTAPSLLVLLAASLVLPSQALRPGRAVHRARRRAAGPIHSVARTSQGPRQVGVVAACRHRCVQERRPL